MSLHSKSHVMSPQYHRVLQNNTKLYKPSIFPNEELTEPEYREVAERNYIHEKEYSVRLETFI